MFVNRSKSKPTYKFLLYFIINFWISRYSFSTIFLKLQLWKQQSTESTYNGSKTLRVVDNIFLLVMSFNWTCSNQFRFRYNLSYFRFQDIPNIDYWNSPFFLVYCQSLKLNFPFSVISFASYLNCKNSFFITNIKTLPQFPDHFFIFTVVFLTVISDSC